MVRFLQVGITASLIIIGPFASAAGVDRKCVSLIRARMLENKIAFVNLPNSKVDDYAEIANRERLDQNLSRLIYSIEQAPKSGKVTSIGLERVLPFDLSSKTKTSKSLELELTADEDSKAWPLNLSLEYETFENGRHITFSQKFNINANCISKLKDTSFNEILQLENNRFSARVSSYSEAGGDQIMPVNQVSLPMAGIWARSLPDSYNYDDFQVILPKIKATGVFDFIGEELSSMEYIFLGEASELALNPLTKQKEMLVGHTIGAKFDGKVLDKTLTTLFSRVSPFKISRQQGLSTTIGSDLNYWLQASLTRDRAVSIVNKVKNSLFDQPGPLLLRVSTSGELKFPNLGAYWKQVAERPLSGKGDLKFQYDWESQPVNLPKNLPAFIPSNGGASPFLKETKYVQVSLPEIQKMRLSLVSGFTGTRLDMVDRVLRLVDSTIKYDHAMVADRQVTALTTEAVLKRKSGVCQHYANLFAALGRSVGLPVRIIMGFRIDDNEVVGHAWNEVEISPDVWLPVEPQDSYDIDFSSFVPLAISLSLDSGEMSSAAILEWDLGALTSYRFEGRKAPKRSRTSL